MSTFLRAFCAHGLLTWIFVCQGVEAIELHVATGGYDEHLGTAAEPLATLTGARDRIRQLRQAGDLEGEPVTVVIHGGTYELTAPWQLTAEDSGTAEAPVIYRAATGENVRIVGGRSLTNLVPLADEGVGMRLTPAAARAVLVSDLTQLQISDYGRFEPAGYDRPIPPAPLELFVDGEPMPIAGWPDAGWARVSGVDEQTGATFSTEPVEGDPLPRTTSADTWVHGFWQHDWADTFDSLRAIQSTADSRCDIHLADQTLKIKPGQRFRVVNLLEELDRPGEWYLDRARGQLYFWPPPDAAAIVPLVSMVETAVSLYGVSHVSLEGVTIEVTRVMGIEIAGGAHVGVRNCKIVNIGNVGVHIYHGQQHEIVNCEVAHTGDSAIRVEAGDRTTLTASWHRVSRNRIHHFGRTRYGNRAGVDLSGVGVSVTHNHIHHGPDKGILLAGNEHDVAYNEIDHVALLTDDVGGIYLAHDPTYRGNQIRHNWLHDLGGSNPSGVIGIYLDDFASGAMVVGNVCRNTGRGIVMGGGRDHVVENNVIVDCLAGIQVDCRGQTWASHWFAGDTGAYLACLQDGQIDLALYEARYPELANVLSDEPDRAKNNLVRLNIVNGPHALELLDGLGEAEVRVESNFIDAVPNVLQRDLFLTQSRIGAELLDHGFQPIYWERIGPEGTAEPADEATRDTR